MTEPLLCEISVPDRRGVNFPAPDVPVSELPESLVREVLPLPEGAHMRTGAYMHQAWMVLEFEDELLRSAYPEMFRNSLIVLAEELGGMTIWIAGFGDPYFKGIGGGGNLNSTIRLDGYNSKELKKISDGVLARLDRNRRVRNARLTAAWIVHQAH